ncbi:MAG TPA: DoxX family membrane protein [Candidatus Limnocylindrales bacterium]|nr:DoxX family membrane protein [Candidatus Limnocylindrales bacterium]
MESLATRIIRWLLGLLLVVAGLNKFLHFMPDPPHNEAGMAFMMGLVGSGYMLPLIAIVEIVCGLAFLTGRFVALAAVVLAPVALNIVLFHVLLDSTEAAPGLFVGAATVYLLAVNYSKYQEMLRAK